MRVVLKESARAPANQIMRRFVYQTTHGGAASLVKDSRRPQHPDKRSNNSRKAEKVSLQWHDIDSHGALPLVPRLTYSFLLLLRHLHKLYQFRFNLNLGLV